MTRLSGPKGSRIASSTTGVATAPVYASAPATATYAPNFTAGPTGLDPYRPWVTTTLDGLIYVANGYDQPKRWDGSTNFYNLGAAPATGFSLADSASGTTFTSGTNVRYKLVFRNSTIAKESPPQQASSDDYFDDGALAISHTMSGTKDIDVTWTDPGGEFDQVAIYRALAGSDTYHRVATVTASTETYTDSVADATLRTNVKYRDRYATALPSKWEVVASHLGRLWGFPENSTKIEYSQQWDVSTQGELLQEDIAAQDFIDVSPEDGLGYLRAFVPHYDSAYVFKERGAYELSGDTAATFSVRRVYSSRGCLNQRCIAEVDGVMLILDDRGLYMWAPGAEPQIAGTTQQDAESRLEPIWQRMNMSAAKSFFIVADRDDRTIKAFIALDYEPLPNVCVVYDYATNKFLSVDTTCYATAGGYFVETSGRVHETHGCDLGYAWEADVGTAEGVYAGDFTATVTSGSATLLTASGASLDTTIDGPAGAPFIRTDASGTELDNNRAYAATATSVTPYYYDASTVTAGDIVYVGTVPAVARTGKFSFGNPALKAIRQVVMEFDSGYSSTLTVQSAQDDGAFATLDTVDMTSNVRDIVPVNQRCWTWSLQLKQSVGGGGFSVRGARVKVRSLHSR